MSDGRQIGIDRRIRLEWLEYTASMALAGQNRESIVTALQELLADSLSGGGESGRGCREKTITVLTRVWSSVPNHLVLFRNDGLDALNRLPLSYHLAIHWAAIMAAYPFWKDVAETVGRLIRLQGVLSHSQVSRRMRETYGERQTVSRSCQRILRSFVDWGVIVDTDDKGTYRQGAILAVDDAALATLLVEAILLSGTPSTTLRDTIQSPALFPFMLVVPKPADIEQSGRMELSNQGLDDIVVSLKR